MAGNRAPGDEWHQACTHYVFSRCTDRHRQAVTVSAVAPGIFLKGITPLRTITHENFKLAGATRGTVTGYFCHGDVRSDTVLATFTNQAPHCPGCDAPGSGYSTTKFGFGSVTAMGIL